MTSTKKLVKVLKNARDDIISGKDRNQVLRSLSNILVDFANPLDPYTQVLEDTKQIRPDLAIDMQLTVSGPNTVIVEMLNHLLLKEYLQRDVYEQYSYLIMGPEAISVREHLKEHMEEEMAHIETMQKYVVSYGGHPVMDRLPLPSARSTSLIDVMRLDLELEVEAVKLYTDAISTLERLPSDYIPLRVDLETIVSQEQEHMMDLQRWLGLGR